MVAVTQINNILVDSSRAIYHRTLPILNTAAKVTTQEIVIIIIIFSNAQLRAE